MAKNTMLDEHYSKMSLMQRIAYHKYIYLILLPALVYYIVFKYVPIYGLTLAFKTYKASKGIWGSPWIGLENFHNLTINVGFLTAFKNTIIISFLKIIFGFPMPIILTLLINEMRIKKYKNVLQTIYTFPHFLSWVVVAGMCFNLFAGDGIINKFFAVVGIPQQNLLTDHKGFLGLLVGSAMWKETGWSTILYLAAITSIDTSIYEAARIDGANRFQQMIYVTIPGIAAMMATNLVLSCGHVMDAGFDQVFNMYNAAVFDVADIIDSYVYRITFQQTPDFGFSTAVGMFKGVVNLILILTVNKVVKSFGQKGIV
ncbi:MAG: sugar ABC transporter permease [Clostridia bacterium]|nr:sugar ABC transporter permease [Clostridia bacterium]